MEELIKVYIKINENRYVTAVNSSIFLSDTTNWIQIDEGIGDKYAHAQGNYFDKPLFDEHGICQYKSDAETNTVSERTTEEIQADINAILTPVSEIELLKAQVQAMTERNDFLEDCVAEIAMKVY